MSALRSGAWGSTASSMRRPCRPSSLLKRANPQASPPASDGPKPAGDLIGDCRRPAHFFRRGRCCGLLFGGAAVVSSALVNLWRHSPSRPGLVLRRHSQVEARRVDGASDFDSAGGRDCFVVIGSWAVIVPLATGGPGPSSIACIGTNGLEVITRQAPSGDLAILAGEAQLPRPSPPNFCSLLQNERFNLGL